MIFGKDKISSWCQIYATKTRMEVEGLGEMISLTLTPLKNRPSQNCIPTIPFPDAKILYSFREKIPWKIKILHLRIHHQLKKENHLNQTIHVQRLLWMEEISNNHLRCKQPCKYWAIYHINWLAGFLNHQQRVIFGVWKSCSEIAPPNPTDASLDLLRISRSQLFG